MMALQEGWRSCLQGLFQCEMGAEGGSSGVARKWGFQKGKKSFSSAGWLCKGSGGPAEGDSR